MLEGRLGVAAQEVAETELIDLAHARARHRIDAGHEGAEVLIRSRAYAQHGGMAGIERNVVSHDVRGHPLNNDYLPSDFLRRYSRWFR